MAEFQDDPDILNCEVLLRRLDTKDPNMFVTDSVTGIRRPSSAAFSFQQDGTSVYRKKKLDDSNLNARDILLHPEQIVLSLTVTQVRDCNGLGVCDNPWPKGISDEQHPRNAAHALIVGWYSLSRSDQRKHKQYLAKSCKIVNTQ